MTHFFRLIDGHNQEVDCSVAFRESGKHLKEKVCVQVFFMAPLTQKCLECLLSLCRQAGHSRP